MNVDDVKRVAVIGAGTMGHGIAQTFAQAGMETVLVDINDDLLAQGLELIRSNLVTLAEFGRIRTSDIPSILNRIQTTTDLAQGVKDVQFVTEVVAERPDIKKQVIVLLDEHCPAETIISSSTSGLDVFAIAADGMKRPERLIMAHWYAPPHIIPLVEIAPGPKTASEAKKLSAALMEKIGKAPIVMKRFAPGFIANKIQHAYASAMFNLLSSDLVEVGDIDKAVKYVFGVRLPIVGIVQSMDFNGLDTVKNICRTLNLDVPIIDKKVAEGHLGAMTGKGIYDYEGRSKEEILKKRDLLYLKMVDFLKSIDAFEPV